MPAPPSPVRRSARAANASASGARQLSSAPVGVRQSPGESSGSGSGSGSGPSSRKRVREHNAMANGDAAEALMRDGGPDDDEEYFDVDMDAQDAYDNLEADRADRQPEQQTRQRDDALFVPYYSHLGADDFDDEYVAARVCVEKDFAGVCVVALLTFLLIMLRFWG